MTCSTKDLEEKAFHWQIVEPMVFQTHLISALAVAICKISSGIQAKWSMASLSLFRLMTF
jgi:hypothetical protein